MITASKDQQFYLAYRGLMKWPNLSSYTYTSILKRPAVFYTTQSPHFWVMRLPPFRRSQYETPQNKEANQIWTWVIITKNITSKKKGKRNSSLVRKNNFPILVSTQRVWESSVLDDARHNTARSYTEYHYFNHLKANFQSPKKLYTRILKVPEHHESLHACACNHHIKYKIVLQTGVQNFVYGQATVISWTHNTKGKRAEKLWAKFRWGLSISHSMSDTLISLPQSNSLSEIYLVWLLGTLSTSWVKQSLK
jgi:hypothetical protein